MIRELPDACRLCPDTYPEYKRSAKMLIPFIA